MTHSAGVVQVVQVVGDVGEGSEKCPSRHTYELWSVDGALLAYHDPVERKTIDDIVKVLFDKQLDSERKVEQAIALAGKFSPLTFTQLKIRWDGSQR